MGGQLPVIKGGPVGRALARVGHGLGDVCLDCCAVQVRPGSNRYGSGFRYGDSGRGRRKGFAAQRAKGTIHGDLRRRVARERHDFTASVFHASERDLVHQVRELIVWIVEVLNCLLF